MELVQQYNIQDMTNEQLTESLDTEAQVLALFKDIREEARRRAMNGQVLPGYKMVAGKRSRKWNLDNDELYKRLRGMKIKVDDFMPRKMVGPAAVEKLPLTEKRQEQLKELYTWSAGSPTLVPDSDDREAIVYNAAQAFEQEPQQAADPTPASVRSFI